MLKARYFLSVSRQEPNQWTQSVYWSSAAVSLLCQNAHIVLSCCHLLQIKTLLQCTPAGHQREALSLCLLLAVGFSISFMRMILGCRHQDWSMNHLGGPIHAGGQNGCKVTSADSSHVPVFHHLMSSGASRSISDCFLKSLWGEAVPAVHTYLYELLNSKAFWRVQVKTPVVLCDRNGSPSEAEEKSILNNPCRMPATCTGKQA